MRLVRGRKEKKRGGGTKAKRNCGTLRALLEMRCSTSVHTKNILKMRRKKEKKMFFFFLNEQLQDAKYKIASFINP